MLYRVLFKLPPVAQAPISAPAPVNSKDAVVSDGVLPAKHKPAVFVPAPPKLNRFPSSLNPPLMSPILLLKLFFIKSKLK